MDRAVNNLRWAPETRGLGENREGEQESDIERECVLLSRISALLEKQQGRERKSETGKERKAGREREA